MPGSGSKIGRYIVEAQIGQGGFGSVYRAFDPSVNRPVAIKLLQAPDKSVDSRFRLEASTSGNLNHPNILQVLDFGEQEGMPYLVTELLEGKTLRDLIASRQVVALLDKMSWMSQVARALEYAHAHGVVHRDVKPANIFILPDGTVKLLDFGIAQLQSGLVRAGQIVGTLMYMSPEQLSGGAVDQRTDIWSYGVVYYELLAGRNPFAADSPADTVYRIINAEPPPVCSLVPECPEGLELVIHRALAKDLELRYLSLEDVLFDLEPVVVDLRRQKSAELLADARRLAENNPEDARNVIRQILELDPGNREARVLRDTIQENVQRRVMGPRIDSLLKQAEEQLANRRYSDALPVLEAAIRLDPKNAEISSRLEQARALQDKSIRTQQLLQEADRKFQASDLDSALTAATSAAQADPASEAAAEILRRIQEELAKRAAERQFQEGINRAHTLLLIQDFEAALHLLDQMEAQFPDDSKLAELRSKVNLQQRENARRSRHRSELGDIRRLLQTGQVDSAAERLTALRSEFPDDPSVTELLQYAREEIAARSRRQALETIAKQATSALEQGNYSAALALLDDGLGQHAADADLLRLRESAARSQATEQRNQALQRLIAEIESLRKQKRLDEAAQRLEVASTEFGDEAALAQVRSSLEVALRVQKVIAQARQTLDQNDPEAASKLLDSLTVPAESPEFAALKLRASAALAEQQRRQLLDRRLARIRELEQAKDPMGALPVAEQALSEFPGEPGLKELYTSLQEQIASTDAREQSPAPAPPVAAAVSGEFTRVFPAAPRVGDEEFSLLITESPNPSAINKVIRVKSFPFSTGSLDPDLAQDGRLVPEHITIERSGGRFSIRAGAPGVYLDSRAIPVAEQRPLFFDAKIRLTEATHAIFEPKAGGKLPDLSGVLIAGRYRIVTLLHESTTAAVYRAEDEKLPKSVALKVLTPWFAGFESYVEQFQNEGRVAARLRHPNICRVLDFGVTTVALAAGGMLRVVYLCMELMEGGTLRERLEGSANISLDVIAGWIKTIAEALDHAHRNNVIHCGLKPNSIVFDTDANLYLTDFALATQPGDATVRAIIGAPAFLAPEQWAGAAAVPATDQYSLSVLAYCLIAGTKPFEGQDDPDARRKNLSRQPVPAHLEAAHAGRSGVPPSVSRVLEKALSVDPIDRYPSTSAFAAALTKAFADPITAGSPRVKPRVFFSYCRDRSGPWATLYSIEMERKGISVFIDVGRQDSAMQFPERIKNEIQSCDVFLCFVADGTFQSAWVDKEVRIAFESNKPMMPILQEPFRKNDPGHTGEHVQALLSYNGIRLIDQFVKAGIAEAVRVIKQTVKVRIKQGAAR